MENRTQTETKFNSYLEMVAEQNASDLHLVRRAAPDSSNRRKALSHCRRRKSCPSRR